MAANRQTSITRTAFIALALSGTVLAGCNSSNVLSSKETMRQGYVIDEESLALVPPGSSRDQVLLSLGTPSTTNTFDGQDVFYYISQTRERAAMFLKPKLVDQRILAVYFTEDQTVERIANYGIKDGKVFDFIKRATPTGGQEQTFLGQIMSGALGAKASQVLGQ